METEVLSAFPKTDASAFKVNRNILQASTAEIQAQGHSIQKIPNLLMLFQDILLLFLRMLWRGNKWAREKAVHERERASQENEGRQKDKGGG